MAIMLKTSMKMPKTPNLKMPNQFNSHLIEYQHSSEKESTRSEKEEEAKVAEEKSGMPSPKNKKLKREPSSKKDLVISQKKNKPRRKPSSEIP